MTIKHPPTTLTSTLIINSKGRAQRAFPSPVRPLPSSKAGSSKQAPHRSDSVSRPPRCRQVLFHFIGRPFSPQYSHVPCPRPASKIALARDQQNDVEHPNKTRDLNDSGPGLS